MDNTMGERIRQKRLEHNMTMEELGAKLNVQKAAINKWENGSVENIKRSSIKKMAEMFECSPAWLMGFDDVTNGEGDESFAGISIKIALHDKRFAKLVEEYYCLPESLKPTACVSFEALLKTMHSIHV